MYINTFLPHILKRGYKEEKVRLFSVMPSARTQGNGHKLKHRFCLNRKHFFTLRVTKHWPRLPKGLWRSLEILKKCLDTVLGKWL